MAWYLYLIPVIGTGLTVEDARRAKYISALGASAAAMDYGFQPVMLAAADVDDATDISLQLNADVHRLPDNLDAQIGSAALAIVQNALETRHLPAHWITATTTYRVLLRTLLGFFSFLQRYAAITHSTALVFGGAVNLDTRLNQLSVSARQNLRDTAISLGLNIDSVGAATPLRAVLKEIADQFGQRSFSIGGITV